MSILTETQRPKTPEIVDLGKLLPQQETPVPKTKMKTINWNKIPSNKLMGKNNIWTLVADSHQNSPMAELDWNEMEGLFCQQATSTQNSPKMGARDTSSNSTEVSNGSERKSRKENSEVCAIHSLLVVILFHLGKILIQGYDFFFCRLHFWMENEV